MHVWNVSNKLPSPLYTLRLFCRYIMSIVGRIKLFWIYLRRKDTPYWIIEIFQNPLVEFMLFWIEMRNYAYFYVHSRTLSYVHVFLLLSINFYINSIHFVYGINSIWSHSFNNWIPSRFLWDYLSWTDF